MEPAQAESAHRVVGASAQSQFSYVKITQGNRNIPAPFFGNLILVKFKQRLGGRPNADPSDKLTDRNWRSHAYKQNDTSTVSAPAR
jgi:hypothetical protein